MPADAVDMERLELFEELRQHLTQYRSDVDRLGHESGYAASWLNMANGVLHRLDSAAAGQFESLLIGDGTADRATRMESAYQFAGRNITALAARVYALPANRPADLLDRLERIGADATSVALHAIRFGGQASSARYLLEKLNAELFDSLDAGRSQLSKGAEEAVKALHGKLVDTAIQFNMASVPSEKSGEFFSEALRLHQHELPVLKAQMVEQFRLMREARAGAPQGAPSVDKAEFNDLKKRIETLETFRTAAVAIATVLGISGAFLFKSVWEARTEMETLRAESAAVTKKVAEARDEAVVTLQGTAKDLSVRIVEGEGFARVHDKLMGEVTPRLEQESQTRAEKDRALAKWLEFIFAKAKETGMPNGEGANGWWQKALIDGAPSAQEDLRR